MDFLFYAFFVLIFIAVALAIEVGWQWWFSTQSAAARRALQRRKTVAGEGQKNGAHVSLLKQRRLAASDTGERLLRDLPQMDALDLRLQQAGSKWSVGTLLTYSALLFFSGLLLALLLQPFIWVALVAGLVCGLLPIMRVLQSRTARFEKLERQLPDAADLIARSLRAGHAFPSTIQMVADEMPEPIAQEFRVVADEINFGIAVAQSLQRLATRVPLKDFRFLVVAVLIQRETGGNLSELMNNISFLIRQRLKLLGQIRTLSAEGRLSARILCLLPFGVLLVLSAMSPAYINQLRDDPSGFILSMTALGMMLVGVLWMREIVRIRV